MKNIINSLKDSIFLLPFSDEKDEDSINNFLKVMATNDTRIRKSYMSKKVGKITNYWNQAKEKIQVGELEKARIILDKCLLILAIASEQKVEILDNVKVDLWKDRVWLLLEEKELLL